MAAHTCELDSPAIVLVGSFDPRVFQPLWLGAKGFVRPEEAEQAEVLVSSTFTRFNIGSWLTVEVQNNRFTAIASDIAHAGPLLDLVGSLFRLLEHTPFHQLGINRQMHYRMATEDARMKLGRMLAPPIPWTDPFVDPLMLSLTMKGKRPDASSALVNATVQPSVVINPKPFGVYIATNEHFEEPEKPDSSERLLDTLAREWQASLDFGKALADRIIATKTVEK